MCTYSMVSKHKSSLLSGQSECHSKSSFHQLRYGSLKDICNSYTMGWPPVPGDNPRALASELSYLQVDKHAITILCVVLAIHEIFHA